MGGKMILMCRNPKDTAVSTFRFAQKANPNPYTGDFEEFLQYFIAGDGEYLNNQALVNPYTVKPVLSKLLRSS